MSEQKKIIIIDGDSFIHRAYHGYKTHNKYATEINFAIKGFTSMLSKILNERESDFLAIVMDHQGKNFRHELDSQYKANRPEKEASFLKQIYAIHEHVKASGLPYFCVEGVEGDDVIGFLAKKAQRQNWKTEILTGDKDIAQILDHNTSLIDTRFNKTITLNNIEENFGVEKPYQIIDYLAIQGDKADNIMGLDNCGKKTAQKLILDFDAIENLLKASENDIRDSISKVTRSKVKVESIIDQVKNSPEKLLMSKVLTTLKTDLDLKLTLKDIKFKQERIDVDKLEELNAIYSLSPLYSMYHKTHDIYKQCK